MDVELAYEPPTIAPKYRGARIVFALPVPIGARTWDEISPAEVPDGE